MLSIISLLLESILIDLRSKSRLDDELLKHLLNLGFDWDKLLFSDLRTELDLLMVLIGVVFLD